MASGVTTVLYPVSDMAAGKQLFGALFGVEPIADSPYYVGYKVAGQDIGLVPSGQAPDVKGPMPYWHVDDIHASLAQLVAAGALEVRGVNDVGGGRLVAAVRDADGNGIGLIQDTAAG
jgi:predicted enzyme related to lactoylglutathione lyase